MNLKINNQFLIDISDFIIFDKNTGIQRVVKNLLRALMIYPPIGFSVKPIHATTENGYKYSSINFLEISNNNIKLNNFDQIRFDPGDIFLSIDLEYHVQIANQVMFDEMYKNNVKIYFILYDMIPIDFPQFYDPLHGADELLTKWLKMITRYNGVICISKTVAENLKNWLILNNITFESKFTINWFHLGCDFRSSLPSKGFTEDSYLVLENLKTSYTFIMVGTLEPRKGHEQVLDAFELIWLEDNSLKLVIIGKKGWMVDSLANRIINHPEFGQRLFWLQGISDEYLDKIYENSICLIMASYAEGFGLPIIEAAYKNIPVFARNIPIFREVAGESAYFFDALSPLDLKNSLLDWLYLFKKGSHPKSEFIMKNSWKESAFQLQQIILKDENINVQR